MTDTIEVEARAYVEAYDQSPPVNLSFKYLVDMLTAIDVRDAEIARLREEIARLHTPPGADALERARRMIEDATRKRPGWSSSYLDLDVLASALQKYGDERAREANEARAKAQGWCDAHQVYHRNYRCEHGGGYPSVELVLEAREAAFEESAQEAWRKIRVSFGWSEGRIGADLIREDIRALMAKPGSES